MRDLSGQVLIYRALIYGRGDEPLRQRPVCDRLHRGRQWAARLLEVDGAAHIVEDVPVVLHPP